MRTSQATATDQPINASCGQSIDRLINTVNLVCVKRLYDFFNFLKISLDKQCGVRYTGAVKTNRNTTRKEDKMSSIKRNKLAVVMTMVVVVALIVGIMSLDWAAMTTVVAR